MTGSAGAFAAAERRRLALSLGAIAELTSILGALPGRKAVVTISGGLPQQPGLEAYERIDGLCPGNLGSPLGRTSLDASTMYRQITAHANANGVTLYTLDAAGVPQGGMMTTMATNQRGGLHLLARETGGRTLFNSNNLAPLLADFGEHLEGAYSLGFRLEEPEPGETRTIRVALVDEKAEGRRLDYGRSLRLKTEDEKLAEELLGVAWLGRIQNPLTADVRVLATQRVDKVRRRKDRLYRLDLELSVPAGALTVLPGPGAEQGSLRVWLMALRHEDSARSSVRQ